MVVVVVVGEGNVVEEKLKNEMQEGRLRICRVKGVSVWR